MRIDTLLKSREYNISFEIFPPKPGTNSASVNRAVCKICSLGPDMMSVTYGAGGSSNRKTLEIARYVRDSGIEAMPHLTCTNSLEDITKLLEELNALGIENIMVLRGDLPLDSSITQYFEYASDLISYIRSRYPHICIGAACYPEGHPESPSLKDDLDKLKIKVDAGTDFLTTQMFFDNDIFDSFSEKLLDLKINVPVIAGIMPVTSTSLLKRINKISNSFIPQELQRLLEKFGDSQEQMHQAGIHYATIQIIDLMARGYRNFHIYTMNKSTVAESIYKNLSSFI